MGERGRDGTLARLAFGALLVVSFTSSVFAETIDTAWLSKHGRAPYVLDQARTTYTLQNDLTVTGTAFVVGAANVTLDLNGHTVRYGDAALPINNGGFEQGIGPTDVPGWTLGSARLAVRAPAIRGMWGSWCLHIPNISAAATIVSDPILISTAGREYAAVITPKSGASDSAVKLDVIDSVGLVLGTGNSSSANRGMSAVAKFTPTAAVSVRLRVTLTPALRKTDTFFLDGAALLPSQDFGIVASRSSWYFPAQLKTSAITKAVSNAAAFTLKNGTVFLASGGYAASAIYATSLGGLTVDAVTFVQEGRVVDTPVIAAANASNPLIQNSTFNLNGSRDLLLSSNRMAIGPSSTLDFSGTSGSVVVLNNHLVNFPQVGIAVTGALSALTISGNRLEGNAQTTNSYALLFSALQVMNSRNQPGQIANNVIIPPPGMGGGQGIMIDGWGGDTRNLLVQNNNVEVYATGDIEYAPSAYEAKALRMRNYSKRHDSITFDSNTLMAWTDAQSGLSTQAMAVRLSVMNDAGQMNGAQVRFLNNQIKGYVKTTSSSYQATALSLSEFAGGSDHSFIGNTFSSNATAVGLGDTDGWNLPVSGAHFIGNTFERFNASFAPSRPFQAIYAGRGSNPVKDVWFVDNRTLNMTGGQLSAQDILFDRDDPKDVKLGWLLDVTVKDNSGNPISGAAIRITDKAGAVYTRSTDATGTAVRIPLATSFSRQLTSDPKTITGGDLNPFTVIVTFAGQTLSQNIVLRSNQSVVITLSGVTPRDNRQD